MRILSLNTWHNNGPWQQRREMLIQGILRYTPDILILQELFDSEWSKEIQARLAFPDLVSTESAYSGLIVLSKLPVKFTEIWRMKTQSPLETCWRYALWVKLDDNKDSLNIFNTHLSWKPEDHATREAQVKELWAFISSRRNGSDKARSVVAGDFNCTPDSNAITWFLRTSDFVDTYRIMHPQTPGFTWSSRNIFAQNHQPPLPDRRIDYIMAQRSYAEASLRRSEVVFDSPGTTGTFASDHFGVLAEFADE